MIEKIEKRASFITVVLLIPIFAGMSINYFVEEECLKAITFGLTSIFCLAYTWVYLETSNDVNQKEDES
jgi:hypothetical protein